MLKLSNTKDNGIKGIKIKYEFFGRGKNYKTTNNDGKITFKTSSLKPDNYKFRFKVIPKKYKLTDNGKWRQLTVK